MSWTHTRWNSVFATILSLYLTSGTNGQGSAATISKTMSSPTFSSIALSTDISYALTPTPTAVPPGQERFMLIYIAYIVGVAVIVTVIVMLICCLCLYCKKRKMRTPQPNRIEGKNSNGNMEPYTLQCYHENIFEWKDFELADPETTSFGVPSNVNSRAPSPESLEYEEILPENFNPLHITNPFTTNKRSTSPPGHITGLSPQVQGMDSITVSSGIKQATSMSALCQQQQQYEAKPGYNQEALDIYDVPTVLAKSPAPVPYHQRLTSLPKHTASVFATQYYSMKDIPGAASHEQRGPFQAKGESLYDIPRAALEASGTEFTRSYQGDAGSKSERVNNQLYYDVPKQVLVAMREKTALQVQENDTTAMQLEPYPWNRNEALLQPVPIPASIPKPFQLASFATNSHAPMSNVSTTVFTMGTCSTYDVPKQVQSNTEQECSSEIKLPSTSKNHEPASMSEHGPESAFLRGDSLSYTHDTPVLTSQEPTTNTDADHYDVPKRLVASRVLTQHQSSSLKTPATSDAWIPHLTVTKPIELNQDDMGIYDMPRQSTPQRIGDEVDSVEDQHIYDLPPTEIIQELRQKRANNHGCSYQLSSATEGTGSCPDKDITFTDQFLESKRKNPYSMATDIEQKPSLGNEKSSQSLQELAIKDKVDTQRHYHMGTNL